MELTRRGFLQAVAVTPAAAALAQLKPGDLGKVFVAPDGRVSRGPISVGLFKGEHEIAGDGYSRAGVAFNAAEGGYIENANEVRFAPAGEQWGTVTHYGLFEEGGELVAGGPLSREREIDSGDTVSFVAGDLEVGRLVGLSEQLENEFLERLLRR